MESVKSIGINPIIIYSSTNKVYGDFEDLTFSETDTRYVCNEYPNGFDTSVPLNFQSPYGCSKGAADQYLLDYYRIFRPELFYPLKEAKINTKVLNILKIIVVGNLHGTAWII